MSIRYDAERGGFVDGKRYVPPAVVAEMLEQAEAEAAKWRWVATHEWVCPLDEMSPGEPGSRVALRNVHPALLARAEEGIYDE
jgi:hypothetical protein